MLTKSSIAQIAHNACEEICQEESGAPVTTWLMLSDYERELLTERVGDYIVWSPATTSATAHNYWWLRYVRKGWVNGPQYDFVLKTMPNLQPWVQCPWVYRKKYDLFRAIAGVVIEQMDPVVKQNIRIQEMGPDA